MRDILYGKWDTSKEWKLLFLLFQTYLQIDQSAIKAS